MTITTVLVNAVVQGFCLALGVVLGARAERMGGHPVVRRYILMFLGLHAVVTAGFMAVVGLLG